MLVNEGRVTHALSVEGFGSTGLVGPGGEAVLEFTVEEEGVFSIWCPVGDHRARGMEGVLVVGLPEPATVTVTETITETLTETVTETLEQTVTETVIETFTFEAGVPLGQVAAAAAAALVVGAAVGYVAAVARRG
jgi:hypothetical protein